MLCTSPHDRLRTPPLRFPVPIAGNTQADGTLSIWIGAVRESGYLGRTPNGSEVPPPPHSYPLVTPPSTPPPLAPPPGAPPPPPLQAPKSFCTRLGVKI